MNRRQILLAARSLGTHTNGSTPETQQADLVYVTKLMLEAQNLRWRRTAVIRELALLESHLIGELREEHQDRPMARRSQRRMFRQQQIASRANMGKSDTDAE